MGWVEDEFRKRNKLLNFHLSGGPGSLEGGTLRPLELEAWHKLLRGFRRNLEEFRRLGGDASLEEVAELHARIFNRVAALAVAVTVDLSARTVRYTYESDQQKTAVPESGILTMRLSGSGVDLYSADQRLSSEKAGQLILEPVLFPTLPTDPTAT